MEAAAEHRREVEGYGPVLVSSSSSRRRRSSAIDLVTEITVASAH